jgi:transcriptional regulator with XRE-family HTH domain
MTRDREWIPRSDARRIAQRLRERRRAMGLTQDRLASKAGVARLTFLRWEKGGLPGSMPADSLRVLEATLQVPPGWLFSHAAQPVPDPAVRVDGASAFAVTGSGAHATGVAAMSCEAIGRHAARFRAELGFAIAEVAYACHVSTTTLSEWEQGKCHPLTAQRLRTWERALLLAPGQLLAPPASHPGVLDGRWRVPVEADTLDTAIRRVAECLATRGRNLLMPEQPLDAQAGRDAELLAHRYGIGVHRWPLIDVAVSHGISLSHARQTIARMIARAAVFAFEIPVLDSIVEASAAGVSSTTAVADGRMRDLLGPSLSMERAAAFAREILSRRIAGADARRVVACTGIPK